MKRILTFFCMLAMLVSLLNPGVFAAGAEEIRVLEADVSGLIVTGDTWIDLNGHSIDGVTVTAGTLYCLDSQTADYTVADGVYGHVTNVTGNIAAAEGYLQVGDSFHAVNLDIYAMTLRADDVGVYYKSCFEADEVVAARVESFGIALSVVAEPNEDNLDTYCGYSQFTGFEAGEGANSVGTSTLLKNIMKQTNGDDKNARNAAMPIYGRAYIKTNDGYFFGQTVKRSLQEQVEKVDAAWDGLKKAQKAPVRALAETYAVAMGGWNIPNILAPAPLIESEEFIYGSYFDHDRFQGNTGTRLTSGDYGKIRSADALLPVQEITVRVKDADLSNYKVTLGYYTKDGIYTGRTGILPMQNGELTITAGEMSGAYFRVNVYIYNGRFTKVPESALIQVYGEKKPVQEQPEEPEQPEQPADPDRPWEGKKIAVVGDSISTGGYPNTVANLTGATLQNLSVSGSKLSGTGAKSLVSLVKGVAADAELVIVFGGTNDYWHKGTHIGAAESTDANTYVGALRTILNYLKENNPNAKYLFVFPANQTFGGNSSDTDFGYGTLDDFRAAFLRFCMENNVHHLDIGATEFDSAKHSGDGVHPNSAGHTIIANAIYDKIATGLEGDITITQQQKVLPEVLSVFPESAIATGNDVEFTNPPYAYQNQTLFAGKHIVKVGIPVKRVAALDENQVFTLSVIKQGSGAYQYVKQYPLTIPTEGLDSTTVNKWIYLDVDIQLAEDETLAFGGKDDTVIWAWKSGLGGDAYKFRDANGGTTTGIFFDIYAETVLTYEEYQKQLQEAQKQAQLQEALTGKGISILGDSISTFQGWSNNTSYNATIGGNYVYYTGSRDGFADVNETWWKQTMTHTGLDLVVNNSWSGDQVTLKGISRSLQLHNNAGRNPDIIAVYLGINDFRNKVTAETFRKKYDEMIAGMLKKYNSADVYLFTLLYTTNVSSGVNPANVVEFNAIIAETAEKYGCTLVDIYNDTGITAENLNTYMGDKALHPNYAGMDLITRSFMDALAANYLSEEPPILNSEAPFLSVGNW